MAITRRGLFGVAAAAAANRALPTLAPVTVPLPPPPDLAREWSRLRAYRDWQDERRKMLAEAWDLQWEAASRAVVEFTGLERRR